LLLTRLFSSPKEHFRKSYRDFCEEIEVCTEILDELGLRRVPHWTTLHKFSKRSNTRRPALRPGGFGHAHARISGVGVSAS